MTPIIKRLELAEAALVKNGFVLVDDVWVASKAKTPVYVEDLLDMLEADKGRSVSVLAGYMGTCELAINAEKLCQQLRKKLILP